LSLRVQTKVRVASWRKQAIPQLKAIMDG